MQVEIYVQLLNEATDVSRPTKALDLGGGLYKILPTPDYNPEDEEWEFKPDSIVKGEKRHGSSGDYLLAVSNGVRPFRFFAGSE